MLYLIGLGLGDAEDITFKGLKVVKRAKRVFLESYTSIMSVGKESLEAFYGRKVIVADREMVESNSDQILEDALSEDIAFLVVGDPLSATTHMDLIIRAKEQRIPYSVIHNTSIISAVACCGLQLYRFGETVSIVLWTDTWEPDSFLDKIESNLKLGLHTLCLLDIKMHEQSISNLMSIGLPGNRFVNTVSPPNANFLFTIFFNGKVTVALNVDHCGPIRGKKIYEPPSFLTVDRAATQLLTATQRRRDNGKTTVLTENTLCVGLARIGSPGQRIVSAPLGELSKIDMGPPLHSLVIAGATHPLEQDMLAHFAASATDSSVVDELAGHC